MWELLRHCWSLGGLIVKVFVYTQGVGVEMFGRAKGYRKACIFQRRFGKSFLAQGGWNWVCITIFDLLKLASGGEKA